MRHKQFILLTMSFKKEEDGRWTAECKEFGTATFGDSLEEAKEAMHDAIELHLNTLEEVGEFERFIKENNIKTFSVRPKDEVTIEATINPNIFTQPLVYDYCGV